MKNGWATQGTVLCVTRSVNKSQPVMLSRKSFDPLPVG